MAPLLFEMSDQSLTTAATGGSSAWRRPGLPVLLLLSVLGLTYACYQPGLGGPLLLDDFWNLQPLAEGTGIDSWSAVRNFVFANDSGPTGRPVAMASLLLDSTQWPPDVSALKTTNLLLHLACGLALAGFALQLFRTLRMARDQAALLAIAVAALWLLHPLQVSTTLYVIQRMTQLMTLFTLLALICYCHGRSVIDTDRRRGLLWLAVSLLPFGLLAVLSKENGALLLLLILLCEKLLFATRPLDPWFRRWLNFGVVLPLGVVLAYLLATLPAALAGYEMRHFSLAERLLTESRVLVDYLANILLPNAGVGRLYFDDLVVSRSLIAPPLTIVAVLAIGLLLTAAGWLRKRQPMLSFAVLWFFSLHLLESTYLPLELYFEHRNYLPMMGPLIAVVWYGWRAVLWSRQRFPARAVGTAVVLAAVALVAYLSLLTAGLSQQWSDGYALHARWADEQPASIRAQQTFAGYLQARGEAQAAMARIDQARQVNPDEVTVLLNQWLHGCANGLSSPVSLADIASRSSLEHYHDDVNSYLRTLIQYLLEQRCEFPDTAVLVALFERIGELPLSDRKRSGYHVFFADLYIHLRQLDPALINLSRAFDYRAYPGFPVRQAILSATAGRFSDALIFLERARQANAERNWLLPSIDAEIERLERDFRGRLAPR